MTTATSTSSQRPKRTCSLWPRTSATHSRPTEHTHI
nr:MAG TPA: hypothetical protein [Caudoviricetes sp.]